MLSSNKQLVQYAKKLVQISLENGQVSEEKVNAVLQNVVGRSPRMLKTVLKLYLYFLKRELRKSQAVIEYSGEISPDSVAAIEKNLSERYGRTVTATLSENPELIAGLRVSVADDVYDATVAGNLNNLSQSVN